MRDALEREAEKAENKSEDSAAPEGSSLRDQLGLDKSEDDLSEEEKAELIEESYELSDEQIEKLEEAESQSVEEAVDYTNSNLEKGVEINVAAPADKSSPFSDLNEASQYFSYLFFQYHTKLIDGPTFYKKMKPHMAKDFINLLPEDEKDRKDMFTALQKLFTEQLEYKIEKYAMTEPEYSSFTNEGAFYRKYTLYNGDEIFYKTIFTKEDGAWKVLDDSPGEGYTTNEYKQTFIENEE
jgi:hypothetical protein